MVGVRGAPTRPGASSSWVRTGPSTCWCTRIPCTPSPLSCDTTPSIPSWGSTIYPQPRVTLYLRQRCGATPIPPGLPQLLHQRTGGNPLFLVAMVDELVRQGLLETGGDAGGSPGALTVLSGLVPTSLRQYIEQHLEQLSEADQALLEAASVAGSTFAVAAVAAGVAQPPRHSKRA